MWLVAAAAIAIAAPDHGRLDRVHLAFDAAQGMATLSLSLSTRGLVAQTATLTIDVPHGARVTAMAVTVAGARTEAIAMTPFAAARRFRDVVTRKLAPALLEQTKATPAYDRLTLAVLPVAKTSRAYVEIVIELPELPTLAVPSETHVAIDRVETAMPAGPRRYVSAYTSLVAAEPESPLPESRLPEVRGLRVWFCDGRI